MNNKQQLCLQQRTFGLLTFSLTDHSPTLSFCQSILSVHQGLVLTWWFWIFKWKRQREHRMEGGIFLSFVTALAASRHLLARARAAEFLRVYLNNGLFKDKPAKNKSLLTMINDGILGLAQLILGGRDTQQRPPLVVSSISFHCDLCSTLSPEPLIP